MIRLIACIALGVVFGNLAWEVLGATIDYLGRIWFV